MQALAVLYPGQGQAWILPTECKERPVYLVSSVLAPLGLYYAELLTFLLTLKITLKGKVLSLSTGGWAQRAKVCERHVAWEVAVVRPCVRSPPWHRHPGSGQDGPFRLYDLSVCPCSDQVRDGLGCLGTGVPPICSPVLSTHGMSPAQPSIICTAQQPPRDS